MEPDRGASLRRYAAAVRASPHNLLSPRGLAELEERHIPECLALARLLPDGPARLVDVGSGAGLPGLVVALARPDLEVTLVEATRKKAAFLEQTARLLLAPVTVVPGRLEELELGPFDLATARAVAPLVRLVPTVVPALAEGGRLFAVKGPRWREELDAAASALVAAGATVEATPDDPRGRDPSVAPPLRVVIIRRGPLGGSTAAAT